MSDTINNGIPLVPENTIDPAAGLNEALNVADALIQVDVISLTVTAPPASPVVGDRYIVPTGATGAWAGQAGKLARWEEGLFWAFYNAQFVTNNGVAYTKTSGGWSVISGSGEANTTSNLGTGTGLAAPKSGVNLPFKSLKAGANVTITSDANEITISSTGGGGGSADWGDIGGDINDQADLQIALAAKQAALVSGTNIKAINGDSLLGSGDLATGWFTPTLVNGWTTFPGYQSPQYKKIGRLVYIRGMVQNPNSVTGEIFNLPSGFRPPAGVAKGLTYGNLTGTFLTVTSSGDVSTGVGAANSALPVDFIFEIAP